jgi:4-hydroxybenzoate polyprenyltransferase
MKNLVGSFKGKTMLCVLCLSITTFWVPFYGSFLFLGEPEIPECLKED